MMVTGGSGSGKSEFAESLVTGLADGPNLYIATMFPFDEECHKRIARHREMRKDKGFDTLECYTGLKTCRCVWLSYGAAGMYVQPDRQ